MNSICTRHDTRVVGILPPSPSRRGTGTCRGCHNERKAKSRAATTEAWRLPEVWDLDTRELIVDEIAIERAVKGERAEGAWITRTEAIAAFQIMQERGYEDTEIADRIGCDIRTIHRWSAGDLPAPPMPVLPVYVLTDEQHDRHRARDAERHRRRRAGMTPEQRKAHRAKHAEYSRNRRARLKAEAVA